MKQQVHNWCFASANIPYFFGSCAMPISSLTDGIESTFVGGTSTVTTDCEATGVDEVARGADGAMGGNGN